MTAWEPKRSAVAAVPRIRNVTVTTTTWTYVGGPLDGRRIGLDHAVKWRTRTGTPVAWRDDPGLRFYQADKATRTYRARGLW